MKTLFLINPTSGRDGTAALKRRVLDYVATLRDADAIVLTRPGQAADIASTACECGYRRLIVVAGDGTFNEVINGLADSDLSVGIVPLGTGNVLGNELGLISDDVDRSLHIATNGVERAFDVGVAGGRRFLLMAGFGFDAAVVRSVPAYAKGLFGRLAYAPTLVLESIRYQPSRFRLISDEGEIHSTAYNVIVCNCATYAPNFQLAADAKADDGLLDVIILEHKPIMKMRFVGWLSASLFTSWTVDSAAHYRVRRLRVEAEPAVKMQLDGDVRGESGTEIAVLSRALRLVTPE
ncbi:MAG: diacylglycerol/lipid kinase family protein [Armatimonadota bacterium]